MVTRSCSMLRAPHVTTPAGLATRGCSYCSVGQNTSPWSRAVVCSWLLAAARGCSQLVAGLRRPGPKSLGRMNAPPMPRSTLRGHTHGRDLLRTPGRNALPGRMWALIYICKRAAQKTADSGTSSRRRRRVVPASRPSADGAAMAPRHRHAIASALSRWLIGIVALAPRRCRACALAQRWRDANAHATALTFF
jgi:hypothetical protein